MKKYFIYFTLLVLVSFYGCSDEITIGEYDTRTVAVQLVYPSDTEYEAKEGVYVHLYDAEGQRYDALTNGEGKALFKVPVGIYRAVAGDNRAEDGFIYLFNGEAAKLPITESWNENQPITINLTSSVRGQVVIKELYIGGCPKDEGSGVYSNDKYVVLYNNSEMTAILDSLCLGMAMPYNSGGTNNDYVDGTLVYEKETWIPAANGIWFYPGELRIEPGQEIVIALNNAINNTSTYSKSIDFRNSSYHCTYDPKYYPNTTLYSVPDISIPVKNYWSAVRYSSGNAWPLSNSSPAFFIFRTSGVDPETFANDENYTNYYGGNNTLVNKRKKVETSWILDGIEVFTTSSNKNLKRLTAKVDVGFVEFENKLGYSLYRNVDVEATLAIPENGGKLVYNYQKGTMINDKPSTDPSDIDAEASKRNGARIIYQDTNNSTKDFHQRSQASLRD